MKKKIILIFTILTLVIVPVMVFATNNIISAIVSSSKNEISIDYSKLEDSKDNYLQNRKQKEYLQKKYVEENYEKIEKTQTTQNQNNILELENKLNERNEALSNNIKYIISIVKKYYPNDIDKILQEAEIEENEMNTSGKYIPISKAECKLIELIVNIIEQENITEDEFNVLKDYISSQDFKLKEINQLELLEKIENIINKYNHEKLQK